MKAGDRVRCVDATPVPHFPLKEGEVYTVEWYRAEYKGDSRSGPAVGILGDGGVFRADRFEVVE